MEEENKNFHSCPVCGHPVSNEPCSICENCGWESSPLQEEFPDIDGGPNTMSLNQAISAYKNGEPVGMKINQKARDKRAFLVDLSENKSYDVDTESKPCCEKYGRKTMDQERKS